MPITKHTVTIPTTGQDGKVIEKEYWSRDIARRSKIVSDAWKKMLKTLKTEEKDK